MTHLEWVIVAVGFVVVVAIVIAASEMEKRLDRIANILGRANEMKYEDRTGEWRNR